MVHDNPCRYVVTDTLSAEQYAGMYCSVNCYVMASRGEGW